VRDGSAAFADLTWYLTRAVCCCCLTSAPPPRYRTHLPHLRLPLPHFLPHATLVYVCSFYPGSFCILRFYAPTCPAYAPRSTACTTTPPCGFHCALHAPPARDAYHTGLTRTHYWYYGSHGGLRLLAVTCLPLRSVVRYRSGGPRWPPCCHTAARCAPRYRRTYCCGLCYCLPHTLVTFTYWLVPRTRSRLHSCVLDVTFHFATLFTFAPPVPFHRSLAVGVCTFLIQWAFPAGTGYSDAGREHSRSFGICRSCPLPPHVIPSFLFVTLVVTTTLVERFWLHCRWLRLPF
jgi:hypothetical protein